MLGSDEALTAAESASLVGPLVGELEAAMASVRSGLSADNEAAEIALIACERIAHRRNLTTRGAWSMSSRGRKLSGPSTRW